MNTDCDMDCRKCRYFSNIFGCLKELNVEECISKRGRENKRFRVEYSDKIRRR